VKFLLLGALAVSAHAATITHFASAVSVVRAGAQFQNQFNLGPALASNSSALVISNAQGAAESSASSDLSTGFLRATVNAVTYSQLGDTSSTRAVASFGDTFRFSGSVAASDAVSFILLLNGTYQPSPLFSPDGNQSLIEIQIRTPGGLTVAGLTGDSSIIARRAYRIGAGSHQNSICANQACSAATMETIEVIETFPKVIQFDFFPGGDFDWEIFFRLGATLPNP